jgi:flagellar biosynthesis/type III secretory pathway M-ring protein FliF/YscJ
VTEKRSGGDTLRPVSWPWLVLLVLAAALAVAVERPRLERRFGVAARRDRERQRRKKQLRVVTPEDESDEFIRSVQRDLDALPTIEERDRKT